MMCKCPVYVFFGWQKRRIYYACLFPSKIVYENNPQAVQIILTHVAKCEGSKLILKIAFKLVKKTLNPTW